MIKYSTTLNYIFSIQETTSINFPPLRTTGISAVNQSVSARLLLQFCPQLTGNAARRVEQRIRDVVMQTDLSSDAGTTVFPLFDLQESRFSQEPESRLGRRLAPLVHVPQLVIKRSTGIMTCKLTLCYF